MEFDPTNDIDSLFKDSKSFKKVSDQVNLLFVGKNQTYNKFVKALNNTVNFNVIHVSNIDDSIGLLLVDIFGIVIIDSDDENIDAVTVSRVVRINHPLARIVAVSKRRGSALIAKIINYGSVNAFLTLPFDSDDIQNLISEQYAKHEISKTLTKFVNQPPKLSKASYLLLDPSLSFDEQKPAKFVGLMIAYNTVPRFDIFFEDLLKKDHLLFAGYLSGVAMLGRELFTNKEPLKEINFGGVSVIFRFHDDIQISIFVRNITSYNVKLVEEVISEIIDEMLNKQRNEIESVDIMSKEAHNDIIRISQKFEKANDSAFIRSTKADAKTFDEQVILLLGRDKKYQAKIKNYLQRRNLNIISTIKDDDAFRFMSTSNCGVLLLDSSMNKGNALSLAEYAKEILPSIQVIYWIRDRRASSPIIKALNSGVINFIISYRASFKKLNKWMLKGLEKAQDIKDQSQSGEGIEQALDQTTIARTMIRRSLDRFKPESKPELHGIFLAKDIKPIFQLFWGDSKTKDNIEFDEEMMAGLVSSLDNVGEEMFADHESIGKLELGGANILVQHRSDFNIAFFVKNIDPNTSVVINREMKKAADKLYTIVTEAKAELDSTVVQSQFDVVSNQIYSLFTELFLD